MAKKPIPYTPPDFPESKLSDEATRTRRNLIAVFAVWMLIVLLELNPTEFTPLGIKFENLSISISTLISFALTYFWVSFVIYANKDWKGWWLTCNNSINEKKDQISVLSGDIDVVVSEVQNARNKGRGEDFNITVQLPREYSNNETNNTLSRWENFILIWEAEKQRVQKQLRQLRTDIYARSAWDYWLPGITIAGPIWHFLR